MIGAASRHIQENGEEKSGSSSAQTTTQSKECIKRVSIWLFFYCINFYSCNSQNELFSSGDRGWFIFRSRPVERMGFSSALFALKFQPSVQQRPVQRDVFSEYIGLTHAQHPRVTPRTTRERERNWRSQSLPNSSYATTWRLIKMSSRVETRLVESIQTDQYYSSTLSYQLPWAGFFFSAFI